MKIENPTLKDLIVSASGRNEELDIPNAACILNLDIFHSDGQAPDSIHSFTMVNPVVKIFRHADTSMVTLTFPTKFDEELSTAYEMLETFREAQNSMDDDLRNIPVVRLVVIPNEYEGRYYILCANPLIWALAPAGLDGEPRELRFAVSDEDINAFDGGDNVVEEPDEEDAELDALFDRETDRAASDDSRILSVTEN